jgi:hypothetical protein
MKNSETNRTKNRQTKWQIERKTDQKNDKQTQLKIERKTDTIEERERQIDEMIDKQTQKKTERKTVQNMESSLDVFQVEMFAELLIKNSHIF